MFTYDDSEESVVWQLVGSRPALLQLLLVLRANVEDATFFCQQLPTTLENY
jgi:hypothetical protein